MKKMLVYASLILSFMYMNITFAESKCITVDNVSPQSIVISTLSAPGSGPIVLPHFSYDLSADYFEPSCDYIICPVYITNKKDAQETIIHDAPRGSRIIYYKPNIYKVILHGANQRCV